MRWLLAVASLAAAATAAAAKPPEIVKQIDDVTVRIVLLEADLGRMVREVDMVRKHPELCPICVLMADTEDSLLWLPVGIAWERDGPLLIDPVITLKTTAREVRSTQAWVSRLTNPPVEGFRTPAKIPPGWKCDEAHADWKGVTVFVAFPRAYHPPSAGWPLVLHLEDVVDAEVRVN